MESALKTRRYCPAPPRAISFGTLSAMLVCGLGIVAGSEQHERDVSTSQRVESLLKKLTFDDFEYREQVVEEIAAQGLEFASVLTRLANDYFSPLRLQARYMLRRTFWELAPKVLDATRSPNARVAEKAGRTLDAMIDRYPLDTHHHGGRQKRGLIFEKLKHYEQALTEYLQWTPPGSSCGTCSATIAAEKPAAIGRCYAAMGRDRQFEAFLWERFEQTSAFAPADPRYAIALVDLYEKRGELDDFEQQMVDRNLGDKRLAKLAREYVEIRRDFQKQRFDRLVTRLSTYVRPGDFERNRKETRYWKERVVAEGFGRLGERAVPALVEHLRSPGFPSAWTIYALRLTGNKAAIEPLIEVSLESQYGFSPVTIETLRLMRSEATRVLVERLDSEDYGIYHKAASVLAQVGDKEAILPFIERFDRPQGTTLYALWRLTGETLGLEGMPAEKQALRGKSRWLAWWTYEQPRFQVKTPEWWQTPEAAPALLKGFTSWDRSMSATARKGLDRLEHPATKVLLGHTDPHVRRAAALHWMRFDPAACMPVLIENANDRSVHSKLGTLTGQNLPADPAAWSDWWEANRNHFEFDIEDRWW